MEYFLTKLTFFSKRRPLATLIFILIATIFSLIYASLIKFDKKWVTINLLSPKLEEVKEYDAISQLIQSEELVVINISSKSAKTFEDDIKIATRIGESLAESKFISYPMSTFREFNSKEFDDFYLKYGLLFMDSGDIASLNEKLSGQRMRKNLTKEKGGLFSFFDPTFWITKKDPLNLYTFLRKIKSQRALSLNGEFIDGVFVTSDKKELYLFADSRVDVDDIPNNIKLVDELEIIKETFMEEDNITLKYSGSNIIALNNYLAIKRDIFVTGIISFIGVILLLYLFFRSFFVLISGALALLISQIFTLSVARFLFGEINFGTSMFIAVIFGLGIDYSTHFFYHYLDQIKTDSGTNSSINESLVVTIKESGKSIIICTLTTSAAFFALSFAEHKGLYQFGIVTSIGILINCIAVLVILPALISLFKYKPQKIYNGKFSDFSKFITFTLKEPLFILIFSALVLVISAVPIYKLKYENEIWKMFAKGYGTGEIVYNLSKKIGFNPQSIDVILHGDNISDVLKKGFLLDKIIKQFKNKNLISYYDSITNYIPEEEIQKQTISSLDNAFNLNPSEFEKNYKLFSHCGEKSTNFLCVEYPSRIKEFLSNRSLITLDSIKSMIRTFNFNKYFINTKNGYILKFKIFPRRAYDNPATVIEIRNKIKESFPTDPVSGTVVLFSKLNEIIITDAKILPPIVILCCFLLVLFQLKSLTYAIVAFIPLIASIIMTFGTIAIFGFKLDFMNLASIPLIIGMGVDNSIHVLNRLKVEKDTYKAFSLSSRGIILASGTTIVGFAALFFADFVGFHSFAFSTMVGITTSMLFSIFVLPILARYFLEGKK